MARVRVHPATVLLNLGLAVASNGFESIKAIILASRLVKRRLVLEWPVLVLKVPVHRLLQH